ncbi:MAG: glutamate--cysteine ligase [Eggerthellaceae bacterium]|nr:glutamate--cysteine ligase [Eggerthellaceae bacterium]
MQPCREQNLQLIEDYLRSGCKGEDEPQRLGVEMEHVLVHEDGRPVSYSEPGGVRDLLERISVHYDSRSEEQGNIVGLDRPRESITIEPAAQLEISAGPYQTVGDFVAAYEDFRSRLDPELQALGLQAPLVGYNPVAKALDLELIPKFRYRTMNEYLGAISAYGQRMMRGSSSLQISIDFYSEADAARKMRLANALVPFFALITNNSPVFEGEPSSMHAVRMRIWEDVDPDRCNIVPGSADPGFTFRDYANYILDVPAILVKDEESSEGFRAVGSQTFGEVYADRVMTRAEMEHALSMEWPDNRLKTYVEIRPADAMPLPYAAAYVALVKGLFYCPENLDAMDAAFADVRHLDVEAAKWKVIFDGFEARTYRKPAYEWVDWLFDLAHAGLDAQEAAYLEPLETLARQRLTPCEALHG